MPNLCRTIFRQSRVTRFTAMCPGNLGQDTSDTYGPLGDRRRLVTLAGDPPQQKHVKTFSWYMHKGV
jgi:hypothetical protein